MNIIISPALDAELIRSQMDLNGLSALIANAQERDPIRVESEDGICKVRGSMEYPGFLPAKSDDQLSLSDELERTKDYVDQVFMSKLPQDPKHFFTIEVESFDVDGTSYLVELRYERSLYQPFACLFDALTSETSIGKLAKSTSELFFLNPAVFFFGIESPKSLSEEQKDLYVALMTKGSQVFHMLKNAGSCDADMYKCIFLDGFDDVQALNRRFFDEYLSCRRTEDYFLATIPKST